MAQNSAVFMYLKNKLPRISDAKIKEGVFVGPQIRELIQDVNFEDQLIEVEKAAWKLFKNVTAKFLGNHKAENCRDMVADLVKSYKAMGCNMSLKVHFLDSHLDFFPENLGAVSMGSDFTRIFPPWKSGTRQVESQYDYCWTLRRDIPQAKYSRKSSTATF